MCSAERRDVSVVACDLNLALDLGRSPRIVLHFVKSCSGVDESVLRVFAAPPSEKSREALCWRVDGPVELRRHVVEPTVVEPELGVSVESVVLIKSGYSCWIAWPFI